MSKIFEFNGNKGSLIDQVSKTKGTLTAGTGGFKKTEKGMAMEFDGSATKIYSLPAFSIENTNFTFECVFKKQDINFYKRIAAINDTNSTYKGWDMGINNYNKFFFRIGNGISFNEIKSIIDIKDNVFEYVVISFDGNNLKLYLNNELNTTITITNPFVNSNNTTFSIGDRNDLSNFFKGQILFFRFYDHELTTQERNELYKEFQHSFGLRKIKRNFSYPKPTDLSNLRNTDFTGDEYVQVMEFTDNTTDSSNLRLNYGGDFAVVDWTGNSDFQEINTTTETESNVIPSTVKIFAKNGVLTYFRSTNNNFSFDIANLPSGLTYYINYGSNTTTGDIANLPSGLTYYYNYGYNTTTGDIANLPSGLTNYYNSGSNTTTGDIANLPSGLTYYINSGYNTTTGDIASLPSGLTNYYNGGYNTTTGDIANLPSGLTNYYNYGYNTTTGDIANLPSGLTYYINSGSNTTTGDIANLPSGLTNYYNSGSNQVNKYTSGRVWNSTMQRIYHHPAAGYGLSSTDVDNLLIDLDNSTTSWTGEKLIDLAGNNATRTSASDSAVTSLQNKGVTVITN